MRLRSLLFCLFLLTISFGFAQHLSLTPKQLIIKSTSRLDVRGTRTGLTAFDTYLQTLGVRSISPLKGMHHDRYYLVNLSTDPDWAALINSPQRFSGIEYIQPNFIRKQHAVPNDTYFPSQLFNLSNIPQAWDYSTSSPLIIVGVVDSGMLREHPDLAPNLYVNPGETINGLDSDGNGYIDDWSGWDFVDAPELADMALGDFVDPDNDVTDENFHGTHVAGIIGAAGNNGIGVSGVCWNVKLMPLRAGFRTNTGGGYLQDDDPAAAIIYAADNGCHVINMSWGDTNYSAIIADACQYAYDKGVILVASAGNDAGPTLNYPAKLSTVISVGSVNRYKVISGFSSYGTDLDLVAPGEQIIST
ncbi:MAG: S8 family serine peptidase, partial [Candidatus Cloacimonetes bacterium]|nr:S8 family serine peptidase [Candidatus Cloacimonadota bacterium]